MKHGERRPEFQSREAQTVLAVRRNPRPRERSRGGSVLLAGTGSEEGRGVCNPEKEKH